MVRIATDFTEDSSLVLSQMIKHATIFTSKPVLNIVRRINRILILIGTLFGIALIDLWLTALIFNAF
jgi:hypothetical protein